MKWIKFIFKLVGVVAIFIFLYFGISFTLSYFPTKESCNGKDKSIYFYSTNEGLLSHTELIIQTNYFDEKDLRLFDGLLHKSKRGYMAFSYGDRDFMMNTKGFDDINLTLAFKGLFINTPALMKVGHYGNFYKNQTIKIDISDECLKKLEKSIIKSFSKKDGKLIRYNDSLNDGLYYYYQANRSYNLFHTCNTWVGDRLRDAGVGMSYWSPFADNIIKIIQKR